MRRAFRIIVVLIVLVIGGGITAAYLMLDKIVHTVIEVIGPEATGVNVKVESVSISPLSGKFGLKGLVMGNPPGFTADRSLYVRDFKVEMDMSSLLGDVVVIEEVFIDGLAVTWEGLRGDNHKNIMENINNYAARFKQDGKVSPAVEKDGKPGKRVIIRHVYLQDSSMDFVAGGGKLATVPVPSLHMTDIGGKEEGESAGVAIKDMYGRMLAALDGSARKNAQLFRDKLGELGKKGRELLDQTRETTSDISDEAVRKLDYLMKDLDDRLR